MSSSAPLLTVMRWLFVASLTTGCAVLHATQLGEIDSNAVVNGARFEIKVSEMGLNTDEAVAIAETIAEFSGKGEEVSTIGDIIALFQMGPKTGNPVFRDNYSDKIATLLAQECPSGNISGLVSIRESANYPVVSGEIVRLTGYCFKD